MPDSIASMSEVPPPDRRKVREIEAAIQALKAIGAELPDLLQRLSPDDEVDSENVTETVSLCLDFLAHPLVQKTYVAAPSDKEGRQVLNNRLLGELVTQVRLARGYLAQQDNFSLVDSHLGSARQLLAEALKRAEKSEYSVLEADERNALEVYLGGVKDKLRVVVGRAAVGRSESRAKVAAEAAKSAERVARVAAGKTGDSVMAAHYEKLGTDEAELADKFRTWTIVTSIFAGCVATVLLLAPTVGGLSLAIESHDYVHLVQRVVLTAAIFGLAGYLARQAHQHRSMANWAKTLGAQLKTFDAYLAPIVNQDVADELRKSFGARAFGDHPAMKGEPTVAPSAAALDTAVGLVAKLKSGAQ